MSNTSVKTNNQPQKCLNYKKIYFIATTLKTEHGEQFKKTISLNVRYRKTWKKGPLDFARELS